jgi:hypothetical protein
MAKARSAEDQIRKAAKKIGFSLRSLEAHIAENGGDFDARATARGRSESIRIIIRTRRADKPVSWAMSVLMNNQRIDGIDWEPLVHDHRGKSHDCRGWHRHMWSPKRADTDKECLPKFGPSSISEFLHQGLALLNVQLQREGQHDDRMLGD